MKISLAAKILLVSVLTFLVLEFLLLAFQDLIFYRVFFAFDPDLGFRVRPHVRYGNDRANEFGFNDRDYSHARNPQTFRILILGDSFNWSGGPEVNYTALLEKRLQQEFGEDRVEVICAGYPGTHTAEQLALLEKYGLQYEPDLVVLGFYAGNDFAEADPRRKRIVVGGATLDIVEGQDFYTTLLGQPLILRSRLLLFVQEKWKVSKGFSGGMSTREYLRLLSALMEFTRSDRAAHFEHFESYILESLTRMNSLLTARGIGFVVAAFPGEVQVDPELREALAQFDGRPSTDYQWERAQSLVRQWCTRNRVEFHDLLPHFREAHGRGERLYVRNDTHWNAAGNQLASQWLFEPLAKKAGEALEKTSTERDQSS